MSDSQKLEKARFSRWHVNGVIRGEGHHVTDCEWKGVPELDSSARQTGAFWRWNEDLTNGAFIGLGCGTFLGYVARIIVEAFS